jgi:serine/threonine-protein kinase
VISVAHEYPHISRYYDIGDMIGVGGMGVVYHAMDKTRRTQVAIKALAPSLRQRADAICALRYEAVVERALDHPGIVRTLTYNASAPCAFKVMGLETGTMLASIVGHSLRRNRSFLARARRWAKAFVLAVQYMHSQGIVHGDLKPGNIVVRSNDTICLIDFGAAAVPDNPELSHYIYQEGLHADIVHHTTRYASESQLRGEPLCYSDDWVAVKRILVELFAGELSDDVRLLPWRVRRML